MLTYFALAFAISWAACFDPACLPPASSWGCRGEHGTSLLNDVWIGSFYYGELPPALFLTLNGFILLLGQLPAYRVLMVWVYDRTGSLLVATLMHASLTACAFVLGPSATGVNFLIYGFVLAAAWWIVVAVVVASQGALVRDNRFGAERRRTRHVSGHFYPSQTLE